VDIFSVLFGALVQLWFIVPFFLLAALLKSRWFKGVFGEFVVNRLLSRLPKNEYTVVKDVTLPTENGTTQIDHIVVSKFGVFVIETKNMKGWIFGSVNQKQWTQKIYRHSSKFQNPLHQNYKHVKTLELALECPPSHIHSLIVFVGDSTFKTEMPSNVMRSKDCLKFIRSFSEVVLSDSDVKNQIDTLEKIKLKPGIVTNLEHRKHVKEIIVIKANERACPRCGSGMVFRETKRGDNVGQKFWGCSTFPKCRAVIKLAN
jgi:hypothetical protein